jgi:transposase
VVRRHELTDQAWAQIAPLLPATGRPGGQWADHRRVVNGILWKLATGVPWRDLPERYGPWQTCYERFRRWQADGTWQRLLAHAQTRSDAVGEVDWEVVVDATIVRAHQHAARVRRARGRPAATHRQVTRTSALAASGSFVAYARVEHGVEHVGDHIEQHHKGAAHDQAGQHDVHI